MWKNGRHPPMPPRERAKQFLPFAAVTGLEEALREKERLYDRRAELSSDMEEELDRLLHTLTRGDTVRLVHFLDGRYQTQRCILDRVDREAQTLLFLDADPVLLSDIRSMERVYSEESK